MEMYTVNGQPCLDWANMEHTKEIFKISSYFNILLYQDVNFKLLCIWVQYRCPLWNRHSLD
jgi:hypothetical protein